MPDLDNTTDQAQGSASEPARRKPVFARVLRDLRARHGGALLIPHNMDMAARIRARRSVLRKTQRQAAQLVGVPYSTYTMWENGAVPDSQNLPKLVAAFKMSAEWFLYGYSSVHEINKELSTLTLAAVEIAFAVNTLSDEEKTRVKNFICDLKEDVRNSNGRNKDHSSP